MRKCRLLGGAGAIPGTCTGHRLRASPTSCLIVIHVGALKARAPRIYLIRTVPVTSTSLVTRTLRGL